MLFYAILAEDVDDSLERRLAARPAHLARLEALQEDGRLLIAGDDGRLTMDLVPTADGGWEGRWLVFEKMGIRLEPKT